MSRKPSGPGSLQGVPENWAGQAEHQLVTGKLFMCTSRFSWWSPELCSTDQN